MLLNEIFNTTPDIIWTDTNTGYSGTFELDGYQYIIKADEWTFKFPDGKELEFLDIGFTGGPINGQQSLEPTNMYKGPRVLGSFLNGIKPIIKKTNPQIIFCGAQRSDPYFDSRMSLYKSIASMYMKHSDFHIILPTINTNKGSFFAISKISLSEEQLKYINNFVNTHFGDK